MLESIHDALAPAVVARVTLVGMGLDLLGGCYLAYDLLGSKSGFLLTATRSAGYFVLFFLGYLPLLGSQSALLCAAGMSVLLAVEYGFLGQRLAGRKLRAILVLIGFLRGVPLGLAAWVKSDLAFGVAFGFLAGAALAVTCAFGFAPADDYVSQPNVRLGRHRIIAALLRAIAVGFAGLTADILGLSNSASIYFGLEFGAGAGFVSATIATIGPIIEWRIEQLPDRTLGLAGVVLIFFGILLQSVQYWLVALAE